MKAIIALLTLVLAGLVVHAPQAGATDLNLSIVTRHSQMCLDVQDSYVRNGTWVVQRPCGRGAHTTWELVKVPGTNLARIAMTHVPWMCMDVWRASTAQHAKLQVWWCAGHGGQPARLAHQEFWVHDTFDHYRNIVASHSLMCLDVPNESHAVGVQIQQHNCVVNAPNQFFRLATPN